MKSKRILIVDDDPDLLFLAAHGVKSLGADYHVTTASNGAMALDQVQQKKFDLILTDYMMPEMTGLDLVREARKTSPETPFILMTAHHDTSQMREEIKGLNLAGFVGKPFTVPDLLKVVQKTISRFDNTTEPEEQPAAGSAAPRKVISEQLKELYRQTGAWSVLLVSADGEPVYVIGSADRANATRLATFVSTNFLAIIELATLFGDNESVFTSSYYEGNNYNIYAYNINSKFFLTVVFSAGGKPGTVWFYTKQVATTLAPLLSASEKTLTDKASARMKKDFDDLVGDETVNNA